MRQLKGMGVILAFMVLVGLIGWLLLRRGDPVPVENDDSARSAHQIAEITASPTAEMASRAGPVDGGTADEDTDGEDSCAAEPTASDEERAADEEETAVDAFDMLTDSWTEPAAKVDMKAIAAFAETFRKVPETRRDECIHRALNLVPDENVMLLAGVLMDKSMPKEIVETVFNDVLNRDEDVKKPILQEIFKDRDHPCWADTAWILDVTGELPSLDRK